MIKLSLLIIFCILLFWIGLANHWYWLSIISGIGYTVLSGLLLLKAWNYNLIFFKEK